MSKAVYFASAKSFLASLMLVILTVLTSPDVAHAGNGTFVDGRFSFCVSVRFNATSEQIAAIKSRFERASQVLADATDGQHRFGTVTVVNNSGAADTSEYWIAEQQPEGFSAYSPNNKYGVRGARVVMFYDANFTSRKGFEGDAYSIVHEFGHHAYGLGDEYSGPRILPITGLLQTIEKHCALWPNPPADDPELNYCIMDNFFIRGGRAPNGSGGVYTLNEFCTISTHAPGGSDTMQHYRHGMSCWETIEKRSRFSAVLPKGLPVSAPPAPHSMTTRDGCENCGQMRVMFLLDVSGSMAEQQRLFYAKRGGNVFMDFVPLGSFAGVASFNSTPAVNAPLRKLFLESDRLPLRTAINALFAAGSTNIGGGLQIALEQITAQGEPSCNDIIVLLSDGDHNTGTAPELVIPALQYARVGVFTVGVGGGITTAGQSTLQNIAKRTGGKYFQVANAVDLVRLSVQLAFQGIGAGDVGFLPTTISSMQEKQIPIYIEEGAASAAFALAFGDETDEITLSLRSPSGILITEADTATNPNVRFVTGPNSRAFQIRAPEAGTWHVVVTAGAITTGKMDVLAFAEHDGTQLEVSVEKDDLRASELMEIHATPTWEGIPVVGAAVGGNVSRPDGTKIAVTLFDDGLDEHADKEAGDGVYSARFNSYSGNGTYTIDLKVENSTGRKYAGETLLFSGELANEMPVPAFERVGSTTAVVTGVPELAVGAVTTTIMTGDGDDCIESNEIAALSIPLRNIGGGTATEVVATLTTSTPGVNILSGHSGYSDIPEFTTIPSGNGVNRTPFTFSSNVACGQSITFNLTVRYVGGLSPQVFELIVPTILPSPPTTFNYTGPPVTIPDGNVDSDGTPVNVPITVSGLTGTVADLNFRINGDLCTAEEGATTVGIDHTYVADLVVQLISPQGTTVTLIDGAGGGLNDGNNFCQTLLDDEGGGPLMDMILPAGPPPFGPPYTGTFVPETPLAAFKGENPNGIWNLKVTDRFADGTGNVRSFSLLVSTYR